jgi:membrane protease YdiL (CAAX protease family)
MAALFFGSGHYIGGQPNLLLGAVITTFLGWALGKSMLESRSILLPWSMHFAINTIMYLFNAMGATLTL